MKNQNIQILPFQSYYAKQIQDLILHIQNNEFAVGISLEEQPDLLDIYASYIKPGGNFFIATYQDQVIGTIGLLKISDSDFVIRKMFVKQEFRGAPYKVAQQLIDFLLQSLQKNKCKIYLGTIDKYQAAIRFYSKNGFNLIEPKDLPGHFPRMKVDNVFFYKNI